MQLLKVMDFGDSGGQKDFKGNRIGFVPCHLPFCMLLKVLEYRPTLLFKAFVAVFYMSFGCDPVPGATFRATHFYLDYTGFPRAIWFSWDLIWEVTLLCGGGRVLLSLSDRAVFQIRWRVTGPGKQSSHFWTMITQHKAFFTDPQRTQRFVRRDSKRLEFKETRKSKEKRRQHWTWTDMDSLLLLEMHGYAYKILSIRFYQMLRKKKMEISLRTLLFVSLKPRTGGWLLVKSGVRNSGSGPLTCLHWARA